MRLSENVHLLRYPHPSSLRRTSMYASFLGISEALHLGIFRQPLRIRFFDSLNSYSEMPSTGFDAWEEVLDYPDLFFYTHFFALFSYTIGRLYREINRLLRNRDFAAFLESNIDERCYLR
jgi:hypothetical protein